jgi:hypothetical protein
LLIAFFHYFHMIFLPFLSQLYDYSTVPLEQANQIFDQVPGLRRRRSKGILWILVPKIIIIFKYGPILFQYTRRDLYV